MNNASFKMCEQIKHFMIMEDSIKHSLRRHLVEHLKAKVYSEKCIKAVVRCTTFYGP